MKSWFTEQRFSILVGAVILCTPAFLNRFPFLYADTGTYLFGGFLGIVSNMRPITYGIFLRHISLGESFWYVIFLQGLMTSWLIHAFFKEFLPNYRSIFALACVFILTLGTNIAICTGMLMPDFLTALVGLSSAIVIFGEKRGRLEVTLCLLILWFGLASHHSHSYILLLTIVGLVFIKLLNAEGRHWLKEKYKKLILVGVFWVLGFMAIPSLHYIYGGKFERENAAHVFLLSRINQMGLLMPFLKQECANNQYNICAYKDNITENFLWDTKSPVYLAGGWEATNEDYRKVLSEFFSDFNFTKKFILKSIETAIVQFFTFEGKIVFIEKDDGAALNALRQVWPELMNSAHDTLQFQDKWEFSRTDLICRFLVFSSILGLLYFFFFGGFEIEHRLKVLLLWIFLFLLANAFICGGISMVDPRFQSRVVWLIPLFAWFILIYQKVNENEST